MGKLLHWKETRTPTINPIIYKCTPNFTPRNLIMEQCDRTEALKNFACTRLKLQQILKRHEKIEAILQNVKQRLEPIQFLLTAADEKNNQSIAERDEIKREKLERNLSVFEQDILESTYPLALDNLISPYSELKTLRVNQLGNFVKESVDSIKSVPNGDWKKILKDLNDWCMEMDSTETLESLIADTSSAIDADASDIPTSSSN